MLPVGILEPLFLHARAFNVQKYGNETKFLNSNVPTTDFLFFSFLFFLFWKIIRFGGFLFPFFLVYVSVTKYCAQPA